MPVIDGPGIRTGTVCPSARRRSWPSIRTTLTLTATVYPTASTTPTATECRTVFRVAPQRAAVITGQAEVGEAVARVAGQDGAVICSTAVGFSLHPSGPGSMTSAIVTLSEHPA